MRRVYRKHCACPVNWAASVKKALPDHGDFLRHATAFERLAINSERRRAGFSTFAPNLRFPPIWGKHKETIAAMSHRKCVYCEGNNNGRRTAQVEHFKPKSLFPTLAYEWTNYFVACPSCNGAKGDQWPPRGGYIRPDRGDPSRHFLFSEDGRVKPAKSKSAAERMIADFELNRTWLADERQQNIDKMLALLSEAMQLLADGHHEPARRLARRLLGTIDAPERAYSVALTQCFWRAWKASCPDGKV